MIKLRYFLVLALFTSIPPVNAGGSHWQVSIDKKIDIKADSKISMKIINSKDPFLKGCTRIDVKLDESSGFLSWLKSLFSDNQEKTANAILSLNDKFINQKVTYFGYIGGGLQRASDNDCSFSVKRLEIYYSTESEETVILAFE